MQNNIETDIHELQVIARRLVIASRAQQGAIEAILRLFEAYQQQQQPAQGAPLSTLN